MVKECSMLWNMLKPSVACAVIINDQNEFLLIRRANEPCAGQWSFISGIGASKKGLPPDEAVKDEVRYDVGADFIGKLAFSNRLHGVEYADWIHVFIGSINESEIRLNPQAATDFKWFSLLELKAATNLAFDNASIVERITRL